MGLRVCLFFFLSLFTLQPGIYAQTGRLDSLAQQRRIELAIRAQMDLPADWQVTSEILGRSDVPGYHNIDVVITSSGQESHVQKLVFLLSDDGKRLARLSEYDLDQGYETEFASSNRPIRGGKEANVQIVVFDDLQCPFCSIMHDELLKTLNHYGALISLVYQDFPLMQIHFWAMHASVDADCLGRQNSDAYWSFIDEVHHSAKEMSSKKYTKVEVNRWLDKLAMEKAAANNVEAKRLKGCLEKQDEAVVRGSMEKGTHLQVESTPVLFIDGERISGAVPITDLWAAIDRALRFHGIPPPKVSP